jgi:16S rRNA (guanine527-N7)-methyltransferase
MKKLSISQIADALLPYGISAPPGLCEAIEAYISLLLRWNSKISLTTVTDPLEIVRFHFGESMLAASYAPFQEGRLADVGTGAGFPGIPIKMLAPELALTLIESNSKKAAFLSEVVRVLELDRVNIFRGRMEDFPAADPHFDFIAARALGMYSELLKWSQESLSAGGKVYLWLGQEDSAAITRGRSWAWKNSIPIPGSERRFLLIGSPILA